MEVLEAWQIISERRIYDFGKYYASISQDSNLAVGQIFDGVRIAVYNEHDQVFDTREGMAYVLTHECDIDQDNQRPFNQQVLVCPIIELGSVLDNLEPLMSQERITNFLTDLAKDTISRVMFFPPINEHYLPYGGVLDFNNLSSLHISWFESGNTTRVRSLTGYSLPHVDMKITNHLLRPKADLMSLPLRQY
jgi:hypothetical protein